MEEYPIQIEPIFDAEQIEIAVERCSRGLGLLETMKSTLAKYPGSVHWHFKKPHASGTLEVTHWPSGNRLWISVQRGRRADWLEELVPSMERCLQNVLRCVERSKRESRTKR
jgi:hypothetical protein